MPIGLRNLYLRNLNQNRQYRKFENKNESQSELIINLFEECKVLEHNFKTLEPALQGFTNNDNVEKINLCLQKKNIIIDNTAEETKNNNSEKKIKINNIKNINNCLYFLE